MDLMSVATGGSAAKASVAAAAGGPYSVPGMKSLFVQVSLVFLLISGFYAMVRSPAYSLRRLVASLHSAAAVSFPLTVM